MATEFTVSMKLGNAAMQTGGDIAGRLRVTADKIEANYGTDYLDEWTGLGGLVQDSKGAPLGRWGIEAPKTAEQIAADIYAQGRSQRVESAENEVLAMLAEAVRAARGER